jgi:hypothetical protein
MPRARIQPVIPIAKHIVASGRYAHGYTAPNAKAPHAIVRTVDADNAVIYDIHLLRQP